MNTVARIGATVALGIGDWVASRMVTPVSLIESGRSAGNQMLNTDSGFVASYLGMSFWTGTGGLVTLATVLLLLLIWWAPLKKLFT